MDNVETIRSLDGGGPIIEVDNLLDEVAIVGVFTNEVTGCIIYEIALLRGGSGTAGIDWSLAE